jgi:hypothetical protein
MGVKKWTQCAPIISSGDLLLSTYVVVKLDPRKTSRKSWFEVVVHLHYKSAMAAQLSLFW